MRGLLAICILAAGCLVMDPVAAAAAPAYAPGKVVVGLDGGGGEVLELPQGVEPVAAAELLERAGPVEYAHPNWIAHAARKPNDPGSRGEPGAWRRDQWNMLGRRRGGVRAPRAWRNVERAGRPGGEGSVVAVVDTGVAYTSRAGFFISPDFSPHQFTSGYDFVDRDPSPIDEDGHGTHIAGTIGEQVDNGVAVTGLAPGATIMPVRVLDSRGEGTAGVVAEGIRFAAREGADVINLSLEFAPEVRGCGMVRVVCDALTRARKRGALVVAAAGNLGSDRVAMPARVKGVMAVAGTTQHRCLGTYSSHGRRLDLVAPGGGTSAALPQRRCRKPREGAKVVQLTFHPSDPRVFELIGQDGTSMAAAHVAAAAALVRASGAAGDDPAPRALKRRLKRTARPIGPPRIYGAGLLDAAKATAG